MKNFIWLAFLPVLLSACYSTDPYNYSSVDYSKYEDDYEYEDLNPVRGNVIESQNMIEERKTIDYHETRKVIYNSRLTLVCKEPDSMINELKQIAIKYKGYTVESSNRMVE